ncbi:MAG TPA: thiamine pyrophosphate-dependent enzyme, partial [Casimicrobiaceae bacterium]
LPDNALIACDTGATVHWYSRELAMRPGMQAAHSGNLASMGAAIPYALAAKLAYPDRPAIALVGDGAMQMNGMNELITVAKYRDRFIDPRFIVIVLNNRDLNMVTWEQRVLEGDPKFPASQDLPDFSFSGYSNLLGFAGMRVDTSSKIVPMLDAALMADRPALLEVMSDPNVPPLPPHVTMKQARNYLRAIARGDADAAKFVRASIKEMFA